MSKTDVRHFNEGRACDAALRFLEYQRGAKRCNMRFPERDAHKFPIDLICDLNSEVIALEHTGTEPFEGHVKLHAESARRVQPLVDAVASRLPPDEDFYLDVPLAEWGRLAGKEFDRVWRAPVDWVVQCADSVPFAPLGKRIATSGAIVPAVQSTPIGVYTRCGPVI